jgi:hypothetical protein
MSQINFSLTHSGTMPNPFSFAEELTTFGTMETSPTLTATKITQDIRPKMDNNEIDVRQVGSHLLYGMQSAGHTYGLGLTTHPFDLPFLKYGTEPPNYTTPAGTSARSVSFALRYKQSTGTIGMVDHYVKFLGFKPNTTEISVSSQGLVEATQEWMGRDITLPTSTAISGASWPTFASITAPALSNVDGGNKPFTVNSVPYAVKDYRIQWNNNLIADQFSGSGLVDMLTVGAIDITGSFNTPTGQDLLLDTAMHDFPQTGVAANYLVKTGTMQIPATGFKLLGDSPEGFSAGPTATNQHVYNFKCVSAGLTT